MDGSLGEGRDARDTSDRQDRRFRSVSLSYPSLLYALARGARRHVESIIHSYPPAYRSLVSLPPLISLVPSGPSPSHILRYLYVLARRPVAPSSRRLHDSIIHSYPPEYRSRIPSYPLDEGHTGEHMHNERYER